MNITGKITWKVKPTHPDIKDMPEKHWKDKAFTFEDEYRFDDDWDRENAIEYMKRDLKLIAGGGYNYNHIYDVSFEFSEEE